MKMHPFNEHRSHKVSKNRVSHITHGAASAKAETDIKPRRATGGAVKSVPMRADGGPVKARADKVGRAKGGRVKGTTVNVIVAPKGQDQAAPAMAAPPPMPPRPPMAPPIAPAPMAAAAPGVGGMPLPPRSDGGRAYKKGGAVKMSGEKKHGKKHKPFKMRASGGPVSAADVKGKTGIGDRTPIQHSGNKSDSQNIGRGPVVTRATGGPIYANGKPGKQMAWLKGVGAGGGKGRLKKAAHAG
jgi:hypothetical protein